MFIVLDIAPEIKDCAAAIILIWLSTDRNLLPIRPHTFAQSNTARCFLFKWGAPSRVIAPQTWIFATSISSWVKPKNSNILKLKSFNCSEEIPNVFLQNSSPRVNWLNTNLMSKADSKEDSINLISLSVKPFEINALWLIAWHSFRLPAPTAYFCMSLIWSVS